jgi:vitamin B12 transporter
VASAATLAASAAVAQVLPPVSEDVVVSATLSPETRPDTTASVTVITREEIEKSGKRDVLELLRQVPGVDVVQSGDAGKVTSVFLRGTNSTQTLVLVDGVAVNSPYFSGYDFSALSTQNVERIEVARGPFSALYGSDAIGGVISIFRRGPTAGPSARLTAAAGTRGFNEEMLFASARAGEAGFTLSGRHVHDDGDAQTIGGTTVDNDGWRDWNGSAAVDWTPSPAFGAGLQVERMFARSEIPSDSGVATPNRFTDFAQTLWTLPFRVEASERDRLVGSLYDVEMHPTAVDPDDTSGFFQSETRATTRGGRLVDTWRVSDANTLSAAGSYARSTVESSGASGTIIPNREEWTWGAGGEDQISLLDGRLRAVAGIRYDRYSTFGSTTNPRLSVLWTVGEAGALRASYGTGFRAPSIGELYYPFFGNPGLLPERSKSFEIGFLHSAGSVSFDVAAFRNDIRDLIQYDVVRQTNNNIGRARTEGIEASAAAPLSSDLRARLSYTYLHAVDEATGDPLVRRPRHRGSFDLLWTPGPWTVSATLLYVGRRSDFQSTFPFGTIEDPSYLRTDLHAEYRFGNISPFVTVENATDRRYEEASGFPARTRRVMGGLVASF